MDDIKDNQCLYLKGVINGNSYNRLEHNDDIYKKGFKDGFYIRQEVKKGISMIKIYKNKCIEKKYS